MTSVAAYKSRAEIDKLFAPAVKASDPEALVSNYLEYELHRLKQRDVDPGGTLQERLRLLNWYVEFYALMRHDDKIRVPLSAAQIDFLNAPMPLGGIGPAASIALCNANANANNRKLDLGDPDQLARAVYWWVTEYTPRRRMDDRLITPAQIALMRSECQWHGEPFALTVFMREYFREHVELHYLELSDPRDRAALLNYLLLLSFSKPVIARMLSSEHVRRALQPSGDGLRPFQQVIGRFVYGSSARQQPRQ